MIAVKIQGGLGNQLFQFAFIYSLAKEFHTIYFLEYTNSFIVPVYFKVKRLYELIERDKHLRKLNRKICKYIKSKNYIDFSDCNLTFQSLYRKDYTHYDGFFQSVEFFIPYESNIRKKLYIRRKFQIQFYLKI